jgi:hypothetical protein
MVNEFTIKWNVMVVPKIEIISWHFAEGTEETHAKGSSCLWTKK